MSQLNKLLCCSCMNARKSGARVLGCRTIGSPELVWRYGNKCRRYKHKPPTELCPGCLYFVCGDYETPDQCLAEPSMEDTTANAQGVINHCKLYKANRYGTR